MRRLQLVPHNTNFNFMGFRFITFMIAGVITLASLAGLMTKGLNYGVDFRGGFILEVRMPQTPDVAQLRDKLSALGLGEVVLQEFGDARDLIIKVERQEGDDHAQENAIDSIKTTLGSGVDYRKIDTVGPKVGGELVQNGLKAVAFALLAMLVYIAIRFEWQFALCAILALAHDCIAILITAGYSINDTIVIFDRIRENIQKYKKLSMGELINKSLNETLSRTTLTATTTLLALLALYFFGGKVISTFSLPIIIGIIIGSFSSICLAAPLLSYLKLKRGEETKD